MHKTYGSLFLFLGLAWASCQKDPLFMPSYKTKDTGAEPVMEVVKIFHPGDTSKGAAHAFKNNNKWVAGVKVVNRVLAGDSVWVVSMKTFAENTSYLRESFVFTYIPNNCEGQTYRPYDYPSPGNVISVYVRWYEQNDVIEDIYQLDTAASDNYIKITKLDRRRRVIMGTFKAAFKIKEPRFDPSNPLRLRFESGNFWAKY